MSLIEALQLSSIADTHLYVVTGKQVAVELLKAMQAPMQLILSPAMKIYYFKTMILFDSE